MLYDQKGELQVCTPDMSTEKMNERKISMQKTNATFVHSLNI